MKNGFPCSSPELDDRKVNFLVGHDLIEKVWLNSGGLVFDGCNMTNDDYLGGSVPC